MESKNGDSPPQWPSNYGSTSCTSTRLINIQGAAACSAPLKTKTNCRIINQENINSSSNHDEATSFLPVVDSPSSFLPVHDAALDTHHHTTSFLVENRKNNDVSSSSASSSSPVVVVGSRRRSSSSSTAEVASAAELTNLQLFISVVISPLITWQTAFVLVFFF